MDVDSLLCLNDDEEKSFELLKMENKKSLKITNSLDKIDVSKISEKINHRNEYAEVLNVFFSFSIIIIIKKFTMNFFFWFS